MDYYSVTSSEDEFRAAICLCGMRNCRGSFLHYSERDDLRQVLDTAGSTVYLFGALTTSCAGLPLDETAPDKFKEYGILKFALGKNPPLWLRTYIFQILKFLEYERRVLPSALLRSNFKSPQPMADYSFLVADEEARIVMESRLQAVVVSLSIVNQLLDRQPPHLKEQCPLVRVPTSEAIETVWEIVGTIPNLLLVHFSSNKAEIINSQIKTSKKQPKIKFDCPAIVKSVAESIQKLLKKVPKTSIELTAYVLSISKSLSPILRLANSKTR
jgi:hypothetical protein